VKDRVADLFRRALDAAHAQGELAVEAPPDGFLEVPRERSRGDLACTLGMTLARRERKPPRVVAEILLRRLEDPGGWIAGSEIAGPGFINLQLSDRFWHEELALLRADPDLGVPSFGAGQRVQVEFVSANPTGPLTVGHGRNAVLGDTLARLLEGTGHRVEREYYFNNAGRQMKVLAESVRARYLEAIGRPGTFPEDGYQGDYIREIARSLVERHREDLATDEGAAFRGAAESAIFADIRATQDRLGVHFDRYFNEDSLYASGAIDAVLADLEKKELIERREGAVWLRGDRVGLEKDRVLVKSSGEPAYRLPDIAYHLDKLARAYGLVVDVLGADHIDEHREVVAALVALGHDVAVIRPVIYQFVTLTRFGEQVKMSTRRAEYVTLDELLDEVGPDAARFFFLTRKSDSHLEFDLELAKKRSTDNPVYYVQYAHARIVNLFGQAQSVGAEAVPIDDGAEALRPLVQGEEFDLIRALAGWGEVVEAATRELEPHRVVFHLQELAAALHRFYNHHRVLGDEDVPRMRARLALLDTVRRVIAAGLGLLGVAAPERM
jgi:arginyl-tRNA synthetase